MPTPANSRSKHFSLKSFLRLGIIGPAFVLLTACSPTLLEQGPTQITDLTLCPLFAGETIGQTFVAYDRGFDGLQVFLQPEQVSTGRIILHLRSEPGADNDLRTAVLPLDQVDQASFYLFNFEPLTESRKQYYYAYLELEGDGVLIIQCLPGDAYIDGAMYRNHEPQDAQLNFNLSYNRLQSLIGLGQETIKWSGILIIGFFLFVAPGLAVLQALWPDSELSIVAQMALSAGLSLAIYPILVLWTDLIGLHLGPLYAWIPVVISSLYLLWKFRKQSFSGLRREWFAWRQSGDVIPDLLLIFILVLIFFSRLYAVRTIDVPMWGDSYQHTMIAQLLVDNNGLFDSWEPYANLKTFTYHFGFHADVAVFEWITGIGIPRATLWTGQLLNGLAILTLYPLALRLGKNRWAGVFALLLAGLLSPMPMTYVNWGRYTQLAGQVILPIAVFLAWEIFEKPEKNWNELILGWLLWGGLALTHYRVLILGICFIPIIFLFTVKRNKSRVLIVNLILLSFVSAIIFLPWFIQFLSGRTVEVLQVQTANASNPSSETLLQSDIIGDIRRYLPLSLWIVSLAAFAWSLLRREKATLIVAFWWLLILLAANPHWIGLPGTGALRNFTVFIAAYIPTSLVISTFISRAIRTPKKVTLLLILIPIIALTAFGVIQRYEDVDVYQHALVTRPDIRAMSWIQDQLPSDSHILVNSFYAYGLDAIVGSDGGWWIPLLAQRTTNIPPLNYIIERESKANFIQNVNALTRDLQGNGVNSYTFISELKQRGYSYAYIGQRQGRVNYRGEHILDPLEMNDSPYYKLLYHQDRVWIFEIQSSQ